MRHSFLAWTLGLLWSSVVLAENRVPISTTPGAIESSSTSFHTVTPRFTVRHDVGDGVGYDNGFTYLEGLLPIWQTSPEELFFGDLRVVNFDHLEFWEFNVGGGYRWYDSCTDRVHGVNVFYDGRTTGNAYYNQIGLGFESLGDAFDVRVNGYIPVGKQENSLGVRNPFFGGNNIFLNRTVEVALTGFDAEVGMPLPVDCNIDTRVFAGIYYYDGNLSKGALGISGRIESRLSETLTLHFAIQNDRIFDTTVSGGLAFHFGGGRLRRGWRWQGQRSVEDRLGDRIVRDPNIVIETQNRVEAAIDPRTGQPIRVCHVNSNAQPGGDGSVDRPHDSLNDVEAKCEENDIVYVHANSNFAREDIVLKAGQRFLGETVPHLFSSVQGTFLLPRATAGTMRPVIVGSPGNAIVLAPRTEVSGINISRPGMSGIFGERVSNVNINRVMVERTGVDGVRLVNVNNFDIRDSRFSQLGDDGIEVTATGNARVAGEIRNNTIEQSGLINTANGEGIEINASNNAVVDLSQSIVGNVIQNTISDAINAIANDNGQILLRVQNNEIRGAGGEGVDLEANNNSRIVANIRDNLIVSVDDDAIVADASDNSFVDYTVVGNRILGGGVTDDGISGNLSENARMRAHIENNVIRRVTDDAIEFDVSDNASLDLSSSIVGNRILGGGTTAIGIEIDLESTGNARLNIRNNDIRGVDIDAISVILENDSTATGTIQGNRVSGTGFDGIFVVVDDNATLTASILSNRLFGLGDDGLDIFSGGAGANRFTIGGNTIRTVADTGVQFNADQPTTIGGQGLNNIVQGAGTASNFDNAGNITGTILINGVPRP